MSVSKLFKFEFVPRLTFLVSVMCNDHPLCYKSSGCFLSTKKKSSGCFKLNEKRGLREQWLSYNCS